jgi:hypothetical protein
LLKFDKDCKQVIYTSLKKVSKRLTNFSFFSSIEDMKRDGVKIWKKLLEVIFGRRA